jgi:hypothetical protein
LTRVFIKNFTLSGNMKLDLQLWTPQSEEENSASVCNNRFLATRIMMNLLKM